MKKRSFWFAFAICFLFSVPMMAAAEDVNIQNRINLEPLIYANETDLANANLNVVAKGSNRLEPTFSFAYRTDSNFYLVDSDYFPETRVDTYLVQPGLVFRYRSGKSGVDLKYTANLYYYDDQDDPPPGQRPASDLDYVGQTVLVNADTQPTAKLTFGLKEYFTRTRNQSEADHNTGLVGIGEKYNYNELEPWLNYSFSRRISSRIAYRNTIINYDKSNPEDGTQNRGLFDLRYHLSPRNSIGIAYDIWKADYDQDDSDYTANQIGLLYRRNAKYLFGEAGIGYQYRDFSDDSIGSYDTFAALLNVTAQSSGLDEIGRPKSYGTLHIEKNFNSSGVPDDFIDYWDFSLIGGHTFHDRILTDAKGYYRINKYEEFYGLTPEGTIEKRDDHRYGIVGSVGYRLCRWMVISVRAGYENRNSNLATYDYDNTYVMARLDSSYDFNLK